MPFFQEMRKLGGRRFIFVGLPPIGCLPIVRTLLGTGPDKCHGNMNLPAASFHEKLLKLVQLLKNEPDTRAAFIDVYTIITKATTEPNDLGTFRHIIQRCSFFNFGENIKKSTRGTGTTDFMNLWLYRADRDIEMLLWNRDN